MKTESLMNSGQGVGAPQAQRHDLHRHRLPARHEGGPGGDREAGAASSRRIGIDDIAVGFFFPIPNTQLYTELMERAGSTSRTTSC
jgi:hypothetical protein